MPIAIIGIKANNANKIIITVKKDFSLWFICSQFLI